MNSFKNFIFGKGRTILAAVLFIVGVVLLLESPIKNYFLNNQQNEVLNELKHLTAEDIKANEAKEASFDYTDVKAINAVDVIKANKNNSKLPSVGEISAPALNMNLPIVKGTTNESMLVSAGTLKPDQKMGEGNYTLASHYSDAYNETLLFSPLKRATLGMKIYLSDGEKIYTYEVSKIDVVTPDRVDVLNDSYDPIITLVTCEDLAATKRRIVTGRLTTTTDVKNATKEMIDAFNIKFKTF